MTTWKTRGLRGSALEDLINRTNEELRRRKLALVQKIPTPITPINIDKENRHITLAYFDKQSTVDYIGAVQGIPVCFDAKENRSNSFPLHNIHEHQVLFMKDFQDQGGIAFLIIMFTEHNKCYYMTFDEMYRFWERGLSGGRKSFRIDELDPDYFFEIKGGEVPYLTMIQKDLERRDDA